MELILLAPIVVIYIFQPTLTEAIRWIVGTLLVGELGVSIAAVIEAVKESRNEQEKRNKERKRHKEVLIGGKNERKGSKDRRQRL